MPHDGRVTRRFVSYHVMVGSTWRFVSCHVMAGSTWRFVSCHVMAGSTWRFSSCHVMAGCNHRFISCHGVVRSGAYRRFRMDTWYGTMLIPEYGITILNTYDYGAFHGYFISW